MWLGQMPKRETSGLTWSFLSFGQPLSDEVSFIGSACIASLADSARVVRDRDRAMPGADRCSASGLPQRVVILRDFPQFVTTAIKQGASIPKGAQAGLAKFSA